MARAGHTLSILNKQNGKWVLARDANMLSPVSEWGVIAKQGTRMPFFFGYSLLDLEFPNL
jgi:hypothetical protein